ncbi:MAG: hypothetical protein ACYC69_17355 [Thermodesulfovibrionales bacterium]
MKIEIGESLIYSYLRHEKNCLIVQTNWKASGNWNIPIDVEDKALYEFDKINEHHAFSEIIKSDFSQTIKQAEIDVLGIDQNDHIYAFEVAFHENGLQYGGKIETRNKIFKKLLRGYITLKCYFPNHKCSIAFCSPKVMPATEQHIQEYFEVLKHDFNSADIGFYYYSNAAFNAEIAQKTLTRTISESDSSELFARSHKLLNITNNFNAAANRQSRPEESILAEPEPLASQFAPMEGDYASIGNIRIPLFIEDNESVQGYVKKIMRLLFDNNILSNDEIERLQDRQYCNRVFAVQYPLIRNTAEGHKDNLGRSRYWSREIFGGNFYVCSQWWLAHHQMYLVKLKQWLISLQNQ